MMRIGLHVTVLILASFQSGVTCGSQPDPRLQYAEKLLSERRQDGRDSRRCRLGHAEAFRLVTADGKMTIECGSPGGAVHRARHAARRG